MNFSDTGEERKKGIGKFILLFMVLIVLLSNSKLRVKFINFVKGNSESIGVSKSLNIENYNKAKAYDDIIVSFGGNKIKGYNLKGKVIFDKELPYKKPIVEYGREYVYLGDMSSGNISAINLKGNEDWSYLSQGLMEYILERDNHLIILSKLQDIQGINILDNRGKSISRIIIEDGNVSACDLNKGNKTLILGTLNIIDGEFNNILKYLSLSGEVIWEKSFNKEIIQNVFFIDDKNIIVLTDSKIYKINNDKKLLWNKDISGITHDIKVKNNKVFLLSYDKIGYLEIINDNGRTERKIKLKDEFDKIHISLKSIILYGKEDISIIGDDNSIENFTYKDIDYIDSLGKDMIIFSNGEANFIDR